MHNLLKKIPKIPGFLFNAEPQDQAHLIPPLALKHGLLISGEAESAFQLFQELDTGEERLQLHFISSAYNDAEVFKNIEELSAWAEQVGKDTQQEAEPVCLSLAQVSMTALRIIETLFREDNLESFEMEGYALLQSLFGYLIDSGEANKPAERDHLLEQIESVSNPENLLGRIVSPMTTMPELGSALRLLESYPGFSFGLIDALKQGDATVAWTKKLKGKHLKIFTNLFLSHHSALGLAKPLIDECLGAQKGLSEQYGQAFKALQKETSTHQQTVLKVAIPELHSGSSPTAFLSHLLLMSQMTEDLKKKSGLSIDVGIWLHSSDLESPLISKDLYALAHYLFSQKSRQDFGFRLFTNLPKPWEPREQGKPYSLPAKMIQALGGYYAPASSVAQAYQDLYGRNRPGFDGDSQSLGCDEAIMHQEVDNQLEQLGEQKDSVFGWLINRSLYLPPAKH